MSDFPKISFDADETLNTIYNCVGLFSTLLNGRPMPGGRISQPWVKNGTQIAGQIEALIEKCHSTAAGIEDVIDSDMDDVIPDYMTPAALIDNCVAALYDDATLTPGAIPCSAPGDDGEPYRRYIKPHVNKIIRQTGIGDNSLFYQ